MRMPTLIAALCLTALTGCHSVDSAQVDTDDINAQITVTARGTGDAEIVAQLSPERSVFGFLELAPGENLRVHARGFESRLEPRWFDYQTYLPLDYGETEFQVRLERVWGAHAPDSWVRMPHRFDLYRLGGLYSLSYDAIPIEWDVISDDEMRLTVSGACVEDYERHISIGRDAGVVIVPPYTLMPKAHWDGGPCELEITVERYRFGSLDRAFGSGNIKARQLRQMSVLVEI